MKISSLSVFVASSLLFSTSALAQAVLPETIYLLNCSKDLAADKSESGGGTSQYKSVIGWYGKGYLGNGTPDSIIKVNSAHPVAAIGHWNWEHSEGISFYTDDRSNYVRLGTLFGNLSGGGVVGSVSNKYKRFSCYWHGGRHLYSKDGFRCYGIYRCVG